VAFVRAALFLALGVIGGYLGNQLGEMYLDLKVIQTLIAENQQLSSLSKTGFAVIGVLAGIYAYSRAIVYIARVTEKLREMPATDKIAVFVGALVGLLLSVLLHPVLSQIEEPVLRLTLQLGLTLILVFLATQAAISMREELRRLLPPYGPTALTEEESLRHGKILDTNIIIDGRIAEICRAGFLEGTIYVPGFVLDELQLIADSGDSLKRTRGRRGLDILNSMQKEFPLVVRSYDHLADTETGTVDARLVRLAKALEATIVTNDFNLNKVAELQGVRVMNVNQLASALRPVVMAGEELAVNIVREGKEPGQGIAYLDDGTMVVVENARRHVGETVTATVSSVLQTVQGKMIFGNLREAAQQEEELMDRNLRSYYSGRGGSGGGGGRRTGGSGGGPRSPRSDVDERDA
jgi:uncharacterized protein YacL